MICARDIGHRVVVRRVAEVISARHRFTDITGELRDIDDTRILVHRDSGENVTIPTAEVVAAKTIPDRPARFSEILTLERQCAATWPAVETQWCGGWMLRASEGWTKRGNTVLALSEPGIDFEDALAYVEQWYSRRGLRPGFGVPLPVARRLRDELRGRGWDGNETAVLTAAASVFATPQDDAVALADSPSSAWLALTLGENFPEVATTVLGSGPHRAYAELWQDGQLAAAGRAAAEGDTAVLSNVMVADAHRRRGLGRRIMGSLAAWAVGVDLDRVALQVVPSNDAAMGLYHQLGFRRHHSYQYLLAPTDQREP